MKSLLASATAVACFAAACLAATPIHAQGGAAAPRRAESGIRVIDIEKAFKNHSRYLAQQEEMKKAAMVIEGEFKKDMEAIQAQERDLPNLKAGSPERRDAEERILQARSTLQARIKMKQKEMADQEAKNLYFVYKEIQDEVREYCRQTGVTVVLQYSSEPMDQNNVKSIIKAMGNPVVHQEGLDITDKVLHYINGNNAPAAPKAGGNGQARAPTDIGDVPRRK